MEWGGEKGGEEVNSIRGMSIQEGEKVGGRRGRGGGWDIFSKLRDEMRVGLMGRNTSTLKISTSRSRRAHACRINEQIAI